MRRSTEIFQVENLEDRFAVCLYLLKDETLGYRQNEVMSDLLGVVKELMRPDRHMDVDRILTRLTRFFHDRDNQFLLMRFKCYEAVGVAIGEADNVKAADHLVEDILFWKFQYPDIAGATDDWETVVNPYHLPKIRCWMHIIESNPVLYERLAAALNVQLRLGGVYIADTDLFQRDVTRFLNADIGPIYFVAKQLLRTLPVYFSEVGAEGELRAVSTEIDEICGRQDTLMHFLRKQCHAESSNRLVVFSRAVFSYWLTLDPSGFEPFLSANTMATVRGEREWAIGPHRVLVELQRRHGGESVDELVDHLLALTPTELSEWLGPLDDDRDRRRVALMARTYQLLAHKYSLSADEVGETVARNLQLDQKVRARFARAITSWQAKPAATARDRLLDAALAVLEELKAVILAPAPSAAVENLYQKRHIAAGIPSIYGNYNEPKFDALGLSFRVENLVGRLLDDLVDEGIDAYVTRESLRRMYDAIGRFKRALAIDGVDSRVLDANLKMLEVSLDWHNFTFGQHQNVFQFLVNGVTELSTTAILSHDQVLRTVLSNDPRQCEARRMSVDAVAEMVLREVLVSALGMQDLDRYVSAALRQISILNGRLGAQALSADDELRPRAADLAAAQAAAGHRRPAHARVQGSRPQADGRLRAQRPRGVRDQHRALHGHAGDVVPAALRRRHLAHPRGAGAVSSGRSACGSAIRAGPCCCRSAPGAAISMPGLMTTFVNVGPQRPARRSARRPARLRLGGVGRLPALPAVVGDVGRRRPRLLRLDHERVQEPLRRRAEARLHPRADARDRLHLQGSRPRGRRDVRRRPLRPGRRLRAQGARVVGLGRRAALPPVHRRGRGVGHRRRRAADGLRQPQSRVGIGRHVHPQPARALRAPGAPVRRLRRPVPGRGPGRRTRVPAADLRGAAARQPDLPRHRALARARLPRGLRQAARGRPRSWSATRSTTRRRSSSPSSRRRRDDLYVLQKRAVVQQQQQAREAPYFDTSSPNFGPPVGVGMGVSGGAYSGRVAVSAAQIDALEPRRPTTTSCCCVPTPCPRTSP